MPWGVRALVFLAASAGLRAGATPPPLTEPEEVSQSNTQDVIDALHWCGKAATRAGVFGAVEINVVNGRRPAAHLGQARHLRPADVDCVRRALTRASLTAFDGRRFVVRLWLPIGEVRPFFTGALVPAWQAAVAGHGDARGKLAALLPPEVRISSPTACAFAGPRRSERLSMRGFKRWAGRPPRGWSRRHTRSPVGGGSASTTTASSTTSSRGTATWRSAWTGSTWPSRP